MEIGAAMSQASYEQRMYKISFSEIHNSIYQIIPLLEQRQETAKRAYGYYGYRDKLNEAEISQYEEMIKWFDCQISIILNLTPNN